MSSPYKIYPTAEQCQAANSLICPIETCRTDLNSEVSLNLHLSKAHQVQKASRLLEKWYYCPHKKCPWSSAKHFKNFKLLRQHHLKVHQEKSFKCSLCQKVFPSEKILIKHIEYCDTVFRCLDCDAWYGCYETLKTHCRRKNHKLLPKEQYKKSETSVMKDEVILNVTVMTVNNQATQTNFKASCCSVETQTPEILIMQDNLKHTNTQTDLVESKETSCNTSFNIEDLEFNVPIETNSSSTQTRGSDLFSMPAVSNLLSSDSLSNLDSSFFNCNSETQTDLMFDNEIFTQDYYSNMYTQTCDEILNGLNGFTTDIQTQTSMLPEMLKSVESQTLMSSADKLCPNLFKDIVHSETQTDEEFRKMLEIINS